MFIVIILFQWMGAIYKAQAYENDLTRHEELSLFEEFTDECWLTWCSKEFEILFYDFSCSFKIKKCSFRFEFFEYKTEHGVIEDSFISSCIVTVNSKEELFPEDFRVPDHIMQQTDKCVNAVYPKALRYYESL